MKLPIYWNEEYCAPQTDFETLRKSRDIAAAISSDPQLSQVTVIKDPADTVGALAQAGVLIRDGLSPDYYQAVMTGRPSILASSSGFAWDEGVAQMVLNSTAGIICAIDDVATGSDGSVAISLSSGLHHARKEKGLGYCTVNSLAIGALYAASKFGKVVILDLDAHFGGGTNEYIKGTNVKQIDLSTQNFDGYEDNLNSRSELCVAPNQAGHNEPTWYEDHYLDRVEEVLSWLRYENPDLVLYNAGVDVWPRVPAEVVRERETLVAHWITEKMQAKTVVVMAGGYGDMRDIVPLHMSTVSAFANTRRVAAGHPDALMFTGGAK